ncbi:MAG: hypothetical protein K2K07_11800 [Lachnospiraceae bacterium]|nr:hypothetical protein [Lachnospiraceae bacterium]
MAFPIMSDVPAKSNGAIVMYTWKNNGDSVFFVPGSKVNTYVKCENGETYPVHVNREGEMEIYCLERNGYAGRHYMNALCIERTKRLARGRMKLHIATTGY